MNEEIEDVFDIRLPERIEGPVPDGGFSDRLMDRLPARRRHISWPMPAGIAAGLASCGFSLWSAPVTHIGWRDWLSGELSAIGLFILMASMAILALAWTAAEADDRYGPPSRRIAR